MNEIELLKFREKVHLITRKAIALAKEYNPQTEAEWKFFLLDLTIKIPEIEVRCSHGHFYCRVSYVKGAFETPYKEVSESHLENFISTMEGILHGVDETIEEFRREEYIKKIEQLLKDEHLDDRYTIERFGVNTWAICSIEHIQGMKTMAGIPENFEAAKALVQAIKEKEEHRGEA